MKKISVIVPVLNEELSLRAFYNRLAPVLSQLRGTESEILFIDDGSTDSSFEIMRDLSSQDKRVRVIKFTRNFGSYTAMTAGLEEARGDAAIILSADLQDPPELIVEMVCRFEDGANVVWAVRRSRKMDPLWKRICSSAFYALFRRVAFQNYPPKGYDFCLISRQVIDVITAVPERNTSIYALIVWANFDAETIEYDRAVRYAGKSNWGIRKLFKLAMDSIYSFSALPVRFGFLCSVFVGFVLLCYMLFIVAAKLTGNYDFPNGWPALMTVILLTSGIQLLVLTLLGEYLWRTLEQTRGRPRFVISQKVGFDPARRTATNATSSLETRNQIDPLVS